MSNTVRKIRKIRFGEHGCYILLEKLQWGQGIMIASYREHADSPRSREDLSIDQATKLHKDLGYLLGKE